MVKVVDDVCVHALPEIGVTTEIAELGFTSVPVLELPACLEKRLLVRLPLEELAAVVTVGDLLGVADRKQRALGVAA